MIVNEKRWAVELMGNKTFIKSIFSVVLLTEKANEIIKLQNNGVIIIMVCVRVNEPPASAIADVEIGIGTGMDVTIASSHTMLIQNDFEGVVRAIKLSRKVLKILKQNIF